MDKREEQLQYELDSDATAQAARLQELIKAARAGDPELPRAHAFIGRMCAEVQSELESIAAVSTRGLGGKYKTWLRALPSDVAAVIAIRECIRACSGPETYVHIQDLAFNVGKLWELEVRIRQAEKVNPMYMQRVHEQVKENCTRDQRHLRRLYNVAVERVFKGTIDLSITKAEMLQIGKFGVDACYRAGMIETVRGVNKNGTTVSYELAEEVGKFIRGYDSSDVRNIISKEESRMLCPPDDWTTLADGGYLSLRRKSVAPLMNVRRLRKEARAAVREQFTAENMPEIFSCANNLQSVPFTMHGPTRDAIVRVWQSGGGVLGVPDTRGPSKPPFPFAPEWVKENAPEEELVVFNAWKREVAAYHTEMKKWRGRVREVGAFVKATRDSDAACWFPVYMDTRGRWYYRGLPNPQGSDMAKAVLHFHEKKPLGAAGLFWLKVHVATAFGFDKARLVERARWTEQNWEAISRALDAPEDAPEVWGTDGPWCMFTAAWELREALRSPNPAGYLTGVPIHQDATCSGLQHFSAMLRDPVGGLYVNLMDPVGCGPKQDVYGRVADVTLQMVRRDTESDDPETATTARWVLEVGIPRSIAKKPVMTYVYGATLRGAAEHVEQVLQKEHLPALGKTWPEDVPRWSVCMYVARKLFQGIAATVPAAAAAMVWLRDVARQQPSGKRMTWTTPTGFIVQHDYQDYTEKQVRLNSCGVVQVWVREWSEGTRSHAMQNAISPNFVHAMDASHLTRVVNAMAQDGLRIVAIHDSFGTHPCDVGAMRDHIREEFFRLYNGRSALGEFLFEVEAAGEAPATGTLDLAQVRDSEFLFC